MKEAHRERIEGPERETESEKRKTKRKSKTEHTHWHGGLKSTTAGDCLEAIFYLQLQTA